ncbi:MAG: hypothetical protein JW990_21155 [Thermoleophilia bacterium]|nr:hypothetical protein [Thermoleophilia bacterium]
MKPSLKAFGALTVLGSVAAGAYYLLFLRSRKPQVELYFDDGSMIALPGETAEAAPFMAIATEVLKNNPVSV